MKSGFNGVDFEDNINFDRMRCQSNDQSSGLVSITSGMSSPTPFSSISCLQYNLLQSL